MASGVTREEESGCLRAQQAGDAKKHHQEKS